jgi:hypothetical protein
MWTYVERKTGRYVKTAYHCPQRGWIPVKPDLEDDLPHGEWLIVRDDGSFAAIADHNFEAEYRELNDDEVVDVALRAIAVVSAECYVDPAGEFWEPTANADAQTLALSAIASVLWRRQMGR